MTAHVPRVALVTGASRGIGRQLAYDLATHGVTVVANYLHSVDAAEVLVKDLRALGGESAVVQADCGNPSAVYSMIATVIDTYGRIDYLINNAGIGASIAVDRLTETDFDQTINNNLKSAFLVTQAVLPHMRVNNFGRLVFMSSLAARTGGMLSAAYAASKAGLEGLMHYYATCLSGTGITANAIAPALIATDMVDAMPHPPQHKLPLGRLGRPEEVWPAVRLLLDCDYVTGQTIHVNAGLYMT